MGKRYQRKYYSINKTEEINLAEHFGITNNGGLNPQPEKVASPNPQLSNPPTQQEKEKSIEGLDSSPHKNSFKNKNNSKNIKKVRQQTLETLKPYITGSSWDTVSDDEDLHWNEQGIFPLLGSGYCFKTINTTMFMIFHKLNSAKTSAKRLKQSHGYLD